MKAISNYSKKAVVLQTCLWVLSEVVATAQPHLEPLLNCECRGWPNPNAGCVAVLGKYAYVADAGAGLQVIDVSNPANGLWVGGCPNDGHGNAYGVAVAGNYAYVAGAGAGLQVIDVSDPAHCVRVGGYTNGANGNAWGVTVAGNYAYVADGAAGLQVIDVSNPTNCVRVGGYDTNLYAFGVAVEGGYAYVTAGAAGLYVIDVSDPTNCVRIGGCNIAYAGGVAVKGKYAYVAADLGLHVIDVSDPANCVRVGGYNCYVVGGVAVARNYAYVAGGYVGLNVIDVRNPTNCTFVACSRFRGFVEWVAVINDRIYLADGPGGLVVLTSLPDVQFTVRVDATSSVPFTVESATSLASPVGWAPLLTTNLTTMPFDFVDFDVKVAEKPQKFYRVRQP